jgi:thioredoxin-dependent peroxiredoxin
MLLESWNQLLNANSINTIYKMNSSIKYWSLLILILMSIPSTAQSTKISQSQAAPGFTVKDVNGNVIDLGLYRGKKVLLSFYRNVGCPICNFRFHEVEQQSDLFTRKGLVVLAVYESSAGNMRQYLANEKVYASMIPNPEQDLYELYDVGRSMGKMMKGMFHGAMGKMKKGKKMFKEKLSQDGNSDRIGADFLIDEHGNIVSAYYGKYVGDHISLDTIKQFIK